MGDLCLTVVLFILSLSNTSVLTGSKGRTGLQVFLAILLQTVNAELTLMCTDAYGGNYSPLAEHRDGARQHIHKCLKNAIILIKYIVSNCCIIVEAPGGNL